MLETRFSLPVQDVAIINALLGYLAGELTPTEIKCLCVLQGRFNEGVGAEYMIQELASYFAKKFV